MLRLAPGIIVMQAVTIFFPIYEGYKSRIEARNIRGVLKEWEENRAANMLGSSDGKLIRSSESGSENSTNSSTTGSCRSIEMYAMSALEDALVTDPHALLQFAATKDFTAENIIFLLQLQAWRTAYAAQSQKMADLPTQARSRLFQMAVDIYAECVSEKTAEFPINIEGPIRTRLDAVFRSAVADSEGRSNDNAVDPWNAAATFDISEPKTSEKLPGNVLLPELNDSSSTILPSDNEEVKSGLTTTVICITDDSVENFDERVFDAAEKSIKYLVLTNTWRKFVDTIREQSPKTSNERLRSTRRMTR
jgi:hypothetical protein